MKGYLSQIASAGAAGSTPKLHPFIRSRSPIAESDQRIGISEWEVPMSLGEREGLPADTAMAEDTADAKTEIPSAGLRQRPGKRPAVEPQPKPSSGPGQTSEETPIRTLSEEAKRFSVDPAGRNPEVRSPTELRETSEQQTPHPENEALTIRRLRADSRDAGPQREASAVAIASPRAAASPALQIHQEPPSADRSHDSPSRFDEPPRKNPEREYREPALRKVLPRQEEQRILRSVSAEISMAEHQEDASPPRLNMPAATPPAQVVIDRLEIEVVQSATQATPTPAAKSEPRREAGRPQRSVSKIGPLSPSTAFRHYLSLRYR